MKKIKRLSLYKKKKAPDVDEIDEEERESEQMKQSPTKSPFGHSLRKKFFSGKSIHRSHSVPEGTQTVAVHNSYSPTNYRNVTDASTETNGLPNTFSNDDDQCCPCKIGDNVQKLEPVHSSHTYQHVNGTTIPAINNICAGDGAETGLSLKTLPSNNDAFVSTNPEHKGLRMDTFYAIVNTDNFLPKENSHAADTQPLSNSTLPAITDELSPALPVRNNASITKGHSSMANDVQPKQPPSRSPSVITDERPPCQPSEHLCNGTSTPSFNDANVDEQLSPNVDQNPQGFSYPRNTLPADRHNILTEFQHLAQQGWYWGPLTRLEAEDKLQDTPEGSFLVRDSSDDRYLLSLSFRSFSRTLHTRIEHSAGKFSFYTNSGVHSYKSVVELIADSVRDSQEAGVFCYSRSRHPLSPTLPVRLTLPISRLSQVRSLQYLCRFIIRQYTRIDHIEKLPLPKPVKGYLNEKYF